jgi:hypothetical protein
MSQLLCCHEVSAEADGGGLPAKGQGVHGAALYPDRYPLFHRITGSTCNTRTDVH